MNNEWEKRNTDLHDNAFFMKFSLIYRLVHNYTTAQANYLQYQGTSQHRLFLPLDLNAAVPHYCHECKIHRYKQHGQKIANTREKSTLWEF